MIEPLGVSVIGEPITNINNNNNTNSSSRPNSRTICSLDFVDGFNADFEKALEATGFGKFHYLLLSVCGLIYLNTAIGITIISFVLPSATCDFQMTSLDKGWLTASPMLGMVIGSYFWGCLADTKGRKVVLIGALLLDGICGLISSICQQFPLFLVFRFINGFGITGAMGICFPYLGEFQPTKYRETILCWMELFWTIGIILLPGIAWLIIPLEFKFESTPYFKFASWNLFVAVCALPSIVIGLWLFAFPESPKFLLECGETDVALEVLKDMYVMNTKRERDTYPVKSLREKIRTDSVVSQQSVKSVRNLSVRKPRELRMLLQEIWMQTKALLRPPHLKYTIITCVIQFGLTTSYYTLMIWFPELFYRFDEFEHMYPNRTASVCDVSSIVVKNNGTSEVFCGDHMDNEVYMHTIIIGLACIPTSFWLPLCVHRLGAKFFLVFSLIVASAVTLGLYFVKSSLQNLVLSCIFEALTSLGISTVYCVMVDLFPTNLRVMAAALSLTWGRGGAFMGNLLFGYMINMHCVVPIVIFSFMLLISGLLCFTLPSTGRHALD